MVFKGGVCRERRFFQEKGSGDLTFLVNSGRPKFTLVKDLNLYLKQKKKT